MLKLGQEPPMMPEITKEKALELFWKLKMSVRDSGIMFGFVKDEPVVSYGGKIFSGEGLIEEVQRIIDRIFEDIDVRYRNTHDPLVYIPESDYRIIKALAEGEFIGDAEHAKRIIYQWMQAPVSERLRGILELDA